MMVPFRVFDRDNKQLWVVINYQSGDANGGSYLAAKESDDDSDGEMGFITPQQMANFKFVEFLEESPES